MNRNDFTHRYLSGIEAGIHSPAMIARWIGAAPRQRGNKEACKFKQPSLGAARIGMGNIRPYAATTTTSAARLLKAFWTSTSRKELGVKTGIPRESAAECTGVLLTSRPRGPLRAGGRV